MPNQLQSIVLTPSPKAYFRNYIVGFILSPLLIGFYLIWKTEHKRRSTRYTISDSMLSISDLKYSINIDLINITDMNIEQGLTGGGTLIVSTGTRKLPLFGLKDPEGISHIIRKKIHSLHKVLGCSN